MTDDPTTLNDGPAAQGEPFDVEFTRHAAFIHAVAQVALVASCEALRAMRRQNLVDASDLAPIHETIDLLRDALAPAFLQADREMFETLAASVPR